MDSRKNRETDKTSCRFVYPSSSAILALASSAFKLNHNASTLWVFFDWSSSRNWIFAAPFFLFLSVLGFFLLLAVSMMQKQSKSKSLLRSYLEVCMCSVFVTLSLFLALVASSIVLGITELFLHGAISKNSIPRCFCSLCWNLMLTVTYLVFSLDFAKGLLSTYSPRSFSFDWEIHFFAREYLSKDLPSHTSLQSTFWDCLMHFHCLQSLHLRGSLDVTILSEAIPYLQGLKGLTWAPTSASPIQFSSLRSHWTIWETFAFSSYLVCHSAQQGFPV